ncbi:hypothetical protein [Lentisalinibacter orientalis]|uniref:hypothetical protein n=1 Tax=Lentisalinibacter orientalis TaxID=2992241 RepID=UPI003868BEB8
MLYDLLVLVHVILFAYWLGGDLGVFYASRFVSNPDLGREARKTAAAIMLAVDMSPRICMVLILPAGLHLAAIRQQLPLSDAALALMWVASFVWLALVLAVHFVHAPPAARALQRTDFGLRLVVIAATAGAAVWHIVDPAWIRGDWIALKLLLFAVTVGCGLAIRIALKPFGPAFASLMEEGSRPATEGAIQRSLTRARPFVIVIWVALVLEAALGIFQRPV